jgi:hypothetical protein
MSWIGSITAGVTDFFNELGKAHSEAGSSIAKRVGSVWEGNVGSERRNADFGQAAAPVFSALVLHAISNKSLSDIRALEQRIQQVIDEGDYEWLNNHEFRIGLGSIVEDPDAVLEKLSSHLKHHPNERLHVRFLKENGKSMRGVDAGGLSRQLISDLFQEIKHSKIIQFEELENGRLLPDTREGQLSEPEMAKWSQIGQVLEYCLEQGLLIGQIFDEGFFDALIVLGTTEVGDDFDSLLSVYKHLRKDDEAEISMINRFELLLNSDSLSDKQKESAYFMVHPDEIEIGDVDNIKEGLREQMITTLTPKIKRHLEPLRSMTRGFHSLRLMKPLPKSAELAERLQGQVDRAYVLEKVSYSGDHPNTLFLTQWIQEASVSELSAFIKATTGASTLGKRGITVQASEKSMAFFHTCGDQIDLPSKQYDQYIEFKAMLTLSIEYGLAGGFLSL